MEQTLKPRNGNSAAKWITRCRAVNARSDVSAPSGAKWSAPDWRNETGRQVAVAGASVGAIAPSRQQAASVQALCAVEPIVQITEPSKQQWQLRLRWKRRVVQDAHPTAPVVR